MIDRVKSGCNESQNPGKETVCISTRKIYDSCRSKECMSDLRVYPTRCSQAIIDRATSVKPKSAQLLWVYIDVEEIAFNKGFYTVDAQFYYRVTCDAFCGVGPSHEVSGLCTFDKRVILFGSEGNARIFSSKCMAGEMDNRTFSKTNLPVAVVEVVDPIALGAKLRENCHHHGNCCCINDIPQKICGCFEDDLIVCDDIKTLFVTLGQFSIVRLERDIQLLMPSCDICMPNKECCGNSDFKDPCEIFERFAFPVDQFFPPALKPSCDRCNRVDCICEKKSCGCNM